MKDHTIALLILLLFLAGCIPSAPGATATAEPSATVRPVATAQPSATPIATLSLTPDYRITNPQNGHQYLVVNLLASWHKANDYCFSLSGHLATIQTAEENRFAASMAIGADMWLGATDEAEEGTWIWISGESWDYSKWYPGEPSNCCPPERCGPQKCTPENFLAIDRTGQWNDEPNKQLFFICEWDSSS